MLIIILVFIILAFLAMYLLAKIKLFKKLNIPFIRFILVGGTNTLIYFFFFTFLNNHLIYLVAHITAFLLSATISYFLTTIYTFKAEVSMGTFIKFPLTYLPNLLMSTLGTWLLVHYGIIDERFASLVTMIAAIPITFLIGKILYSSEKKS